MVQDPVFLAEEKDKRANKILNCSSNMVCLIVRWGLELEKGPSQGPFSWFKWPTRDFTFKTLVKLKKYYCEILWNPRIIFVSSYSEVTCEDMQF